MSANPHTNGGRLKKTLRLPDFREYANPTEKPGLALAENTRPLGRMLAEIASSGASRTRFAAETSGGKALDAGSEDEGCFQAFRGAIEVTLVQAFVVNALELDDGADCAGLGDETPVIDKAEYAALLGQRASFLVILDEFPHVKHGVKFS